MQAGKDDVARGRHVGFSLAPGGIESTLVAKMPFSRACLSLRPLTAFLEYSPNNTAEVLLLRAVRLHLQTVLVRCHLRAWGCLRRYSTLARGSALIVPLFRGLRR